MIDNFVVLIIMIIIIIIIVKTVKTNDKIRRFGVVKENIKLQITDFKQYGAEINNNNGNNNNTFLRFKKFQLSVNRFLKILDKVVIIILLLYNTTTTANNNNNNNK